MWYNISEIRRTDRRLAPKSIVKEITAQFGRQGGYFFLCIMEITKVMIETIKIPKVNKSFTVMYSISITPIKGQDLTVHRLRSALFRKHYTIILRCLQVNKPQKNKNINYITIVYSTKILYNRLHMIIGSAAFWSISLILTTVLPQSPRKGRLNI